MTDFMAVVQQAEPENSCDLAVEGSMVMQAGVLPPTATPI